MSRWSILFILFCASCSENNNQDSKMADPFSSGKWIDLSYDFSEKTIYWPTATGFRLDTSFVGVTSAGFYYEAFNYCAAEHGGTHLDAPSHFAKDKWTTEKIPLESLIGKLALIDVSDSALKNPDYQVSVSDIENWEKKNGRLPDDIILLFRTGYGSFYPDVKKYLGTEERRAEAAAKLHFPGIHPDAAEWLVKNRRIKAVGLDAASVDYGQSKDFKTHQVLYAQNIPGFENVANMDRLPAKGAYVFALPMKIRGGSGAPLRIIAWISDEK